MEAKEKTVSVGNQETPAGRLRKAMADQGRTAKTKLSPSMEMVQTPDGSSRNVLTHRAQNVEVLVSDLVDVLKLIVNPDAFFKRLLGGLIGYKPEKTCVLDSADLHKILDAAEKK